MLTFFKIHSNMKNQIIKQRILDLIETNLWNENSNELALLNTQQKAFLDQNLNKLIAAGDEKKLPYAKIANILSKFELVLIACQELNEKISGNRTYKATQRDIYRQLTILDNRIKDLNKALLTTRQRIALAFFTALEVAMGVCLGAIMASPIAILLTLMIGTGPLGFLAFAVGGIIGGLIMYAAENHRIRDEVYDESCKGDRIRKVVRPNLQKTEDGTDFFRTLTATAQTYIDRKIRKNETSIISKLGIQLKVSMEENLPSFCLGR